MPTTSLNVPLIAQKNDPAFPTAPQTISRDAFMLAWSDFDYLYSVIRLLR